MKPGKLLEKQADRLLALAGILLLFLFVTWKFDYYYELNDDVLIKDILAGVYTGVPEGHNIQMLWPLSAVISCFYRVARNVPWYGLFLCGMHYLCLFLILKRTLSHLNRYKSKLLVSGVFVAMVTALYLEHLVFVHYSITAALMAATAAYLFYTLPDDVPSGEFVAKSVPSILLVVTAYMLRPNMMLLLLPLVGVTGFIRWSREKEPLHKSNMVRYLSVIGSILVLMAGAYLSDQIAYSGEEWSRFETLFANRTELYDFQTIPGYEEHKDFYDSIGLTESEQILLTNYNYGLDTDITEVTIGEVASYAKSMKDARLKERVKEALKNYLFRSFHEEDYPWNLIVWLVYLVLFFTILMRKNNSFLTSLWVAVWRLGLLFCSRSVLWMYILINGRCPVRISHSLYLMELCILLAMLNVEYTRKLRDKNFIMMITGCVFLCGLVILIPYRVSGVAEKCRVQDKVDQYGIAIDEYCKARTDRFYYVDVYSTIIDGYSFADKMFEDVDNSYQNHDLLGGWSCNSPLYRKKAQAMGLADPADNLLYSQKTYLICELNASLDWIVRYYRDKGVEVELETKDIIDRVYGVYQIKEVSAR